MGALARLERSELELQKAKNYYTKNPTVTQTWWWNLWVSDWTWEHALARKELMLEQEQVKQAQEVDKKKEVFLKPLGARLMIQEDEFTQPGSIIIPDTAKRAPLTGVIVAMGPDVDTERFSLGMHVVYHQFAGTKLAFRGRPPYRVMDYTEALAEVLVEGEKLEDVKYA